jgi:poly(3-hydroxybutyrate) depolymerase
MTTNELADGDGLVLDFERPDTVVHGQVDRGHPYTRMRWTDPGGRPLHELLVVEGLGHAWSGGSQGVTWTDARGPDASQAMWDFFSEVGDRDGA